MSVLKRTKKKGSSKKKETVVHKVLVELKNRILEERLKPGDKLPTEQELSTEFEVSRTVIREVIKMLQAVGLVEVIQGKGMFISGSPSLVIVQILTFGLLLQNSTKDQIYDFRKAVEIGVLETVISNHTEEDINKMENSLKNQEATAPLYYEKGKKEESAYHDLMFHRHFLNATKNPLLVLLAEGIWEALHKSIGSGIGTKNDLERTIMNHRRILDSIKNKDKEQARAAIIKALDDWKKYSD